MAAHPVASVDCMTMYVHSENDSLEPPGPVQSSPTLIILFSETLKFSEFFFFPEFFFSKGIKNLMKY